MCGRLSHEMSWRQIHDLYSLTDPDMVPNSHQSNLNAAPTALLPILINEDGENKVVQARWWFHLDWAKSFDHNAKYAMFNARTDRLKDSKAYRPAFERGQRCLVPVNGFYEWRAEGGAKKQCYLIDIEEDWRFSLAGLFNRHKGIPDKDGMPVNYTFTIFTTEPNESFSAFHSRMARPVPQRDYSYWMDPALSPQQAFDFLRPMDEDRDGMTWEFHAVEKPGVQGEQDK
ncbi:SOS response-associated peptidase [Kordiimonas sp.]|uniref:SOS response-associated peptidase n=1 Tax=Kordiimonas sp. TaxID=1970157 RepID=UPI003A91C03A